MYNVVVRGIIAVSNYYIEFMTQTCQKPLVECISWPLIHSQVSRRLSDTHCKILIVEFVYFIVEIHLTSDKEEVGYSTEYSSHGCRLSNQRFVDFQLTIQFPFVGFLSSNLWTIRQDVVGYPMDYVLNTRQNIYILFIVYPNKGGFRISDGHLSGQLFGRVALTSLEKEACRSDYRILSNI